MNTNVHPSATSVLQPEAAGEGSGSKRVLLDAVLDAYNAETCGDEKFNPATLQAFVDRFPEHADGLLRYATVTLTSTPASRESIEDIEIQTEELKRIHARLRDAMAMAREEAA